MLLVEIFNKSNLAKICLFQKTLNDFSDGSPVLDLVIFKYINNMTVILKFNNTTSRLVHKVKPDFKSSIF